MSEPKQTNRQRVEVPPVEALEAELGRMRRQGRRRSSARSTVFTLLIVAAIAVILTILILPVLTIQGVSMEETLFDGDVVATETDWVDIDQDGTVYVNNVRLDEPYIHEKAFGECNINLPYQVPEGCCFVLGDHRATSIDSRNKSVGCIPNDKVVGRLLLRIWPFEAFGTVE